MRQWAVAALAMVTGCVLQTETVSEPADGGNAETIDGLEAGAFMRADEDTGTVGALSVGKKLSVQGDGVQAISARGQLEIEATEARINLHGNAGPNDQSASVYMYDAHAMTANNELAYFAAGVALGSPTIGTFDLYSKSGQDWLQGLHLENGKLGVGTDEPKATLHVVARPDLSALVPALLTESASGEGNVRFHLSGDTYTGAVAGVVISADAVAGSWSFLRGVVDYNGKQQTQFRIASDGNIFARGTFQGGQMFDLAENITATDPAIGPGDVVATDPRGGERIVLSVKPYNLPVLGVVSTSPGILLNSDPADLDSAHDRDPLQRPLALAGRVPVKVTLEGGPIHPGDPLTTSSAPGHAMRAKEPWRGGVIGTALTGFDGKDDQGKSATAGKVIVFLALDSTPTCDPEEQARLSTRVEELGTKLSAEREARKGLEARLRALEEAMARSAGGGRQGGRQ